VNRSGATACYNCGRRLAASKQRQQAPLERQKNKLYNRRMRFLKPTKITIGIACILLLLLFILILVTNPGLTPVGAMVFLVLFPVLFPGHVSDALQGNFSFQTNFTSLFFLLLVTYVILIYFALSILYLLFNKLRTDIK
jgi:hypothetical protein